jgi:hypothetical protein
VVGEALTAAGVRGLVRQFEIDIPGYGPARFDLAIPKLCLAIEVDIFPNNDETIGNIRDRRLGRLSRHGDAPVLGVGSSVVAGDCLSIELDRQYGLAVIEPAVASGDVAAAVHSGAQHVVPGGEIVVTLDDVDAVRQERW